MQISRHWRLNAQRYRLEGVRYENGEVSLQVRPAAPNQTVEAQEMEVMVDETVVIAKAS